MLKSIKSFINKEYIKSIFSVQSNFTDTVTDVSWKLGAMGNKNKLFLFVRKTSQYNPIRN